MVFTWCAREFPKIPWYIFKPHGGTIVLFVIETIVQNDIDMMLQDLLPRCYNCTVFEKHGITTVLLLHICKWSQYCSKPHFSVLLPVVSEEQVQRYVTGEKGGNTTLQCLDQPVNASSLLYRWKKNGAVVANPLKPSAHLSISNNGSLWISGLQYIDEGQYECESQTKDDSSWQTLSNTLLRVAGMVLWISKSY